jgi:hypothetical protein
MYALKIIGASVDALKCINAEPGRQQVRASQSQIRSGIIHRLQKNMMQRKHGRGDCREKPGGAARKDRPSFAINAAAAP